jgi:hypothetical protein
MGGWSPDPAAARDEVEKLADHAYDDVVAVSSPSCERRYMGV